MLGLSKTSPVLGRRILFAIGIILKEDFWNYFELLGIFLYQWASILDITNENTSDICRILFVFSVMFSLIKVLYLIRVFR